MRKNKSNVTQNTHCVDRYINLERFLSLQQVNDDGCIYWTGITNNAGYGFVGFVWDENHTKPNRNHGMMTVHRLAFMLEHDRLPAKRNVNHTCHNKLCVNPAHLVEGTQRDKLDAMQRDGIKACFRGVIRGPYSHKQENRQYKYSDEEIQWVRNSKPLHISLRYGITLQSARCRQWQFRHSYAWLPWDKSK